MENVIESKSCWSYVLYEPSRKTNNKVVVFLLGEFEGLKKNIVSHSEAIWFWGNKCLRNGLKYNNDDIQEAYDIAYGDGCEYKWELAQQ